jgi:predicted naringenin-chalcone synthase
MPTTHITAIGTASPPNRFPQAQAATFLERAMQLSPDDARKLRALGRLSGIDYRHSVLADYGRQSGFTFFADTPDLAPFPDTGQRMRAYEQHALPLGLAAVRDCLGEGQLPDITHLITVSCTGMYAPGLDIELVEHLGLSAQVQRFAINFMGCYAAFNALKLADALCQANANARVLVVAVELCSLHFQRTATDDNLLANTIFADGAAAVLLQAASPQGQVRGAALGLEGFHCGLAPQGRGDMAWHIRDFGFEMRLSAYVPELLAGKVQELTTALLGQMRLREPVDWYAIHPGGKRILQVVEQALGIGPAQNAHAHQVLRDHGNMSSVTILYVLQRYLRSPQPDQAGRLLLGMAFGPGLTMETALLRLVLD